VGLADDIERESAIRQMGVIEPVYLRIGRVVLTL